MVNRRSWVDPTRYVALGDVGGPDYAAATIVTDDNTEHLVLVYKPGINDPRWLLNDAAAVAHEQLGPLPAVWRHRVALAPLRCGRATATGHLCRAFVAAPGGACHRHREEPT